MAVKFRKFSNTSSASPLSPFQMVPRFSESDGRYVHVYVIFRMNVFSYNLGRIFTSCNAVFECESSCIICCHIDLALK